MRTIRDVLFYAMVWNSSGRGVPRRLIPTPNPRKTMKTKPLIAIFGAFGLIVCATWIPNVLADSRPMGGTPWTPNEHKIAYPLGHRCVVTLDPLDGSTSIAAGDANIVTGFVAPNTVEGDLLALDKEWLVIRSGCNENWVPREKVLMIHLCE
jgi:hypothetical protein